MENNPAPNINKILVKRQYIDFICEGEQCAATFDLPHGGQMPDAALIIVSGGHDIRSGYNGAASILAAQIAAQGIAVMRYDRRGIGDSEGVNRGWRQSEADLQAAIIALRDALPHVKRIFAYGNCDAASLLCLHGQHCNINGIIASNPWGYDHDGAHYYIGQSRNENSPASLQNPTFSANGEEDPPRCLARFCGAIIGKNSKIFPHGASNYPHGAKVSMGWPIWRVLAKMPSPAQSKAPLPPISQKHSVI